MAWQIRWPLEVDCISTNLQHELRIVSLWYLSFQFPNVELLHKNTGRTKQCQIAKCSRTNEKRRRKTPWESYMRWKSYDTLRTDNQEFAEMLLSMRGMKSKHMYVLCCCQHCIRQIGWYDTPEEIFLQVREEEYQGQKMLNHHLIWTIFRVDFFKISLL